MAEQFGIRLQVETSSLVKQIQKAIKKAGKTPLNIKVQLTGIDKQIANLKKQITSAMGSISVPKVVVGDNSAGKTKSGLGNSVALSGLAKDQDKEFNAFVTEYRKKFDIIKQSAKYTSSEIQSMFSDALSNVFKANNLGNKTEIRNAFEELTILTQEFAKAYKDDTAITALNNFKTNLQGVVPISKEVRTELRYIYGGAKEAAKALNKAFGVGGWGYTTDAGGKIGIGSDTYLQSLGLPKYEEITNSANGITQLIEEITRLKTTAKQKVTQFDLGVFSSEDIVNYVNDAANSIAGLNKTRQQEIEISQNSAQVEKQTAASLQSVTEVAEKFRTVITPVIGNGTDKYVSQIMSSIEPYKEVVDSLGRSLDSLSSSKTANISSAMSQINDAFSIFREGMYSPAALAKELELIGGVQRENTEIANKNAVAEEKLNNTIQSGTKEATKAINEQNAALKEQNKAVIGQNTKNKGNVGTVSVKADGKAFIKSIKDVIAEINSGDKLASKPVRVFVSKSKLIESIKKCIAEINSGGELSGKPVNLVARFNAKEVAKNLQAQLNGMNVTVRANGVSTEGSASSTAKSVAQQAQAQQEAGDVARNAAQKTVNAEQGKLDAINDTNNAIKEQIKTENELAQTIKNNDRLLVERQRENALTGDVLKSETYGNSIQATTETTLNGKLISTTTTENFEKQRREAEKSNALYQQMLDKLKKIKQNYADINAVKPIKDESHKSSLAAQYDVATASIEKLKNASAETRVSLESDADKEIEKLKRLTIEYQNAEYVAQLRAKEIPVVKEEQLNKLDKFEEKVINSGAYGDLKAGIDAVRDSFKNAFDRETLTTAMNQLSILESRLDSTNQKMKTTTDITKQIEKGISGLDKISSNAALYRGREYDSNGVISEKYTNLMDTVKNLKKEFLGLQESLKKDSSAENVAKVKGQLAGLTEELKQAGKDAAALKSELGNMKIDDATKRKVAQTQSLIAQIQNKNAFAMGKENTISGSGLTFGEELKQYSSQLSQFPSQVDQINSKVRTLQANIKTLGYEGNTLFGEFKEKATKFIKWTGMTLLITKARMYFKQLFTNVYELDSALTDLRKTFNGTNEELEDFYFEANKVAKQMGVTTQEIIDLGSAWSRLGYNTNEAMQKMAKMSSMFSLISPGMDTSEATDGLVAIMKAFDIGPDNVLDEILSKVNIVGNTAATSNDEIVEMLEKSSSAMKEANNTLEETIALETAAIYSKMAGYTEMCA